MNASNSSEAVQTPSCRRFIISLHSVMSGLVLLCIVGNAISLYTWKKVGGRRGFSSSILLLMILAVSDTLINIVVLLVIIVPQFISVYTSKYNCYTFFLFPFFAKYVWPFGGMALFVTTWITCLLCIHRYAVLQFPLATSTTKLTSLKSTMFQVIGITISGILFNIPAFFEFDIEITTDGNVTYANLILSSLFVNEIYNIAFATTTYMIVMNFTPLLITTILTCKIIQLLVKAKAARACMVTSTRNDKEIGISVALVSVVIMFIICQAPTILSRIMLAIDPEGSTACGGKYFHLEDIAIFTITFNSSINIFIYGSCSSQFREELPKCLTKLCCCCKSVKYSQGNAVQNLTETSRAVSAMTLSSQVENTETTQL